MSDLLHLPCPACDTLNRVPRDKLAAGGKCGACHQPLFTAHPVALDSARFLHQLDKSDVPLLVDFWAPWCGPCRVMAPEFERAAARLEPQLRLVKVNIDEAPALAQRFGIASIPTVMLAVHGREIARQPGAVTAAQLERWVRTELARQPIPG
ncbi:MAG TPA: thioredoxin TrxC [Stellaceae bacterium]|nr:thioredoxin TrxC [Stellaceae bacterium]